jgi:hypothetical protein
VRENLRRARRFTQDVIDQGEGRFNLEVMGSAPAAGCLLVELPCPVRWQGFEGEA